MESCWGRQHRYNSPSKACRKNRGNWTGIASHRTLTENVNSIHDSRCLPSNQLQAREKLSMMSPFCSFLKSSMRIRRRVVTHSREDTADLSTHCTTHDRSRVYANVLANGFVGYLCFLFLTQSALHTPVSSQTTVTNNFPPGCMFLYSSHQRMDDVIQDDRLRSAWHRHWTNQEDKLIRTYSCRGLGLSTVPHALTATAEAIFLNNNGIVAVNGSDLAPSTDDITLTSPILVLSLSNNRISSIENDAFRQLSRLRLLILRNNYIENLKWADLNSLPNLTELDLSANQMKAFKSEDFGMFPVLKRLDLSGNNIRKVDGNVLSKFPKLRHLDLSSNSITQRALTPSNLLNPSLMFLSLADNILRGFGTTDVAEFLSKLPNLRILDLSQNQVAFGKLPKEAFHGLSSIQTLNLSSCGIKALKQGWLNGGLSQSLKVLDLSYNLFETISAHKLAILPNVKQNLTSWAELNEITNITEDTENEVHELNSIEVLYLNGNSRLSTVEDNVFDYLISLKLLFLQNCAIRRLNIASSRYRYGFDPIGTTLPMLTNVWIFSNPLMCDCYIRFLKEWSVSTVNLQSTQTASLRYIDAPYYTVNSEIRTVSIEFTICAAPESLAGVTIEAAPEQSMTCQEEPYSIYIAMLIGPLTFAGSVAVTIICGSLQVCIARMKKTPELSFHAREKLMRNRKVRRLGGNATQPIFSGLGWGNSHDDVPVHSTGSRRYTNLVLGQLGGHHQRSEASQAHHRLSPTMALAYSAASLNVKEELPYSRAQNAGSCYGTENSKTEHQQMTAPSLVIHDVGLDDKRGIKGSGSDAGSVLGKESVRTRSHSNDIPFIDVKDQGESDKRSISRLSASSNSSNNSLLRGAGDNLASARDRDISGNELRMRKDTSRAPNNGGGQTSAHHIPGLATTGQTSSEVTHF